MIYKFFWIIRAFIYKPFFSELKLPSYIGPPIYMKGIHRMKIESYVRIYPGMRVEILYGGSVIIEKDVSIGQNFHIVSIGDNLIIGSGTVISTNVMITNSDHEYQNISKPIHKQPMRNKKTVVGKNCFIGTSATLLPGTILGNHCIVGAHSVVKGEFPSYCVIAGSPAKIIKQYDFEKENWVNK